MLANWVKETTTTTGTGTITLGGAVAGFVAFTDQLATGDAVHYSIEDGNNREIGIGVFTTSGTTLSRDAVLETLVSGTLDDTSPAAITLSGSAEVSITSSSFSQMGMGNGIASGFKTVSATYGSSFTSSIAPAVDTLYADPILLLKPTLVSTLGIIVGVAQASSNIRIGIARADANNAPDQLIAEASTAFDTSTTGAKSVSLTTPILLNAGLYYGVIVADTASIGLYYSGTSLIGSFMGTVSNPTKLVQKFSGAYTYAALPTDVGAVTTTQVSNTAAYAVLIG